MKIFGAIIGLISIFPTLILAGGVSNRVIVWGTLDPLVNAQVERNASKWVSFDGAMVTNAAQISASEGHLLILKQNGEVWGIGWNVAGQATGLATETHACGPVLVANRRLTNAVSISAGPTHSMALRSDGSVVVWGGLGEGAGGGEGGVTEVPAGLNNVVSIASGFNSCYALKRDGSVVAWGNGHVPIGISNVVAIAAGKTVYSANLALKKDGTVLQWRVTNMETVPAEATNVMAISAGYGHELAQRRDSTVVAWGSNASGEVTGMATTNYGDRHGVVAVSGQVLTNVLSVSAGYECSIALRKDGTAVSWGHSAQGLHCQYIPAGLTNVVAISAGGDFGAAIVEK